jgi:predicted transcriptional regulator of viral defense system
MTKILNWVFAQKTLRKKKIRIFSPQNIMQIFDVSQPAASFFVYRNTKKGLLIRLKKSPTGSLYYLADYPPDQYVIANRLYEPSYVSFDAALAFHNLIPESIYGVTSATTKTTRTFIAAGIRYYFCRIKEQLFTGYLPILHSSDIVLMAEPEKALTDLLYFVVLHKRIFQYERIKLEKINKSKLIKYAKLYKQPKIFELIEGLYANTRKNTRIY